MCTQLATSTAPTSAYGQRFFDRLRHPLLDVRRKRLRDGLVGLIMDLSTTARPSSTVKESWKKPATSIQLPRAFGKLPRALRSLVKPMNFENDANPHALKALVAGTKKATAAIDFGLIH